MTRIPHAVPAYLAGVLFAIAALGICRAGSDSPAAHDPDAIYQRFREYRLALAAPDRSASGYFSRHLTDEWLGLLLAREDPVRRLDTLEIVRNRFRFGDSVHVVYGYTVTVEEDGRRKLNLICQSKTESQPAKVTVTYVNEGGRWQIDALGFDSRKQSAQRTDRILEEFP